MTVHPKIKTGGGDDEMQYRGFTCRALFNDIRTYAAVICATWFVFGMSWGTYVTSISTIEKRFNLKSTQSGMILGGYEIGHLGLALVISHFGNRFNTPKIVGFATILMAATHGLMTLPKFVIDRALAPLPEDANGTVLDNEVSLCYNGSQFAASLRGNGSCGSDGALTAAMSSELAFAIFFGTFILLGIVGTPINTLAVSYLDDNAESPSQSVLFFGILGCMLSLGPMVGGFMNAKMLSIPEDLQETALTPEHPDWVGAWWLQKMVEMGIFMIPACMLFFFPRKMIKPDAADTSIGQKDGGKSGKKGDNKEDRTDENFPMMEKNIAKTDAENAGPKYTWRSLVSTLHRLLCNPTYIFIILTACCVIYLLSGLVSFLPKYYETQFGISASHASTIIGIVTGVFGCGGNILGGLISSKFKLSFRSMVRFCVVCLAVTTVALISAIFIGCDSGSLVPSSSTFDQNSRPFTYFHNFG